MWCNRVLGEALSKSIVDATHFPAQGKPAALRSFHLPKEQYEMSRALGMAFHRIKNIYHLTGAGLGVLCCYKHIQADVSLCFGI